MLMHATEQAKSMCPRNNLSEYSAVSTSKFVIVNIVTFLLGYRGYSKSFFHHYINYLLWIVSKDPVGASRRLQVGGPWSSPL